MSVELVACPLCASHQTSRANARTFRERFWKRFTKKRLFRCRDCEWRGWVVPTVVQHGGAEWTWQTTSISLSELDAQLTTTKPNPVEGEPDEPARDRPKGPPPPTRR
jgi:hypothetical protein